MLRPLSTAQSNGDRQVLVEEREVLGGELVLQRLGGGGDDDALRRHHERDEVGERLAGSRAACTIEVAPGLDRLGDALGHLPLTGTILGAGERGGDRIQRVDDRGDGGRVARGGRSSLARSLNERDRGVELGGVEVGPGASVKWIVAPALCHSKKFETRCSPLVRTIRSTGGSSGRYRLRAIASCVIAPPAARAARTADISSACPP